MPKVNIYEEDLTTSGTSAERDYIVFIPGTSDVVSGEDKHLAPGELHLFKSADEFTSEYGGVKKKEAGEGEQGDFQYAYRTAFKLLKAGMKVLWVGFNYTNNSLDTGAVKAKFDEIKDKNRYLDLTFITCGDFQQQTAVAASGDEPAHLFSQYAVQIAAERGDCIALIDANQADTTAGTKTATTIDAAVQAIAGLDAKVIRQDKEEFISKYGAAFAGDPKFKTDFNTNAFPTYVSYLLAFNSSIRNNNPDWFAASGSARGVVADLDSTSPIFSEADIDKLQARSQSLISGQTRSIHRATNVVTEIYPYGTIVWGNRTLFPVVAAESEGTEGKTDLVASSFLNIRHLCCDIKKTTYKACRKYAFDPNSDTLWINWKSQIVPLLEKMKSAQGIKGYKIEKVATTKKAVLKAKITIVPIEAVEDFDVTVSLVDSIVTE